MKMATAPATTAMTTAETGTGQFTVQNGQIIAPDGSVFIAKGINIGPESMGAADQILADFPGINFIRLASWNTAPYSISDYQNFISQMSANGVVVEIEDHTSSNGSGSGGSQGTIFTGDELNTELNWYSSLATGFKDNPYVWFGTTNEPSEINPATGQTDAAALSAWQGQIYDTIRATGNASPIMLEMNSGGPDSTGTGYDASVYAGETNVIWDVHYYGWVVPNWSTDQATVDQTLQGIVQAAQTITSADGTMPVIIGEFGDSTTGQDIDPNGTQVVSSVLNSGLGFAAWHFDAGNPGDGLLDGSGGLSAYGQQVAQGIAAATSGGTTPLPGFTGTETAGVGTTMSEGGLSATVTGGTNTSGGLVTSTNPVAGAGTGTSTGTTAATPATPATTTDPQIAAMQQELQSLEAVVETLIQGLTQAIAAMTGAGAGALTTNTGTNTSTGGVLAGAATGLVHHRHA
jgi:hypothetical protein